MANDKDFILKNAIEIGGSTKVTIGDAPASGSTTVGYGSADIWAYDSVSFSVSSQDASPFDIAFNNDGTKMYMIGLSNDSVHQYTLSTAFDLSTASYDSVSFSVSGQDASPTGITFNSDGTKMYMCGDLNDSVHQYTLSTAFDLSTASYDSVSFSAASQDNTPVDIDFNNDGTKLYILGLINDTIYQYSLSTAFDLSTASYDSVSFSLSSQDNTPRSIAFNSDGTKMYMCGFTSDTVHQYTLSTAFDLSTASYDSVSFSVSSQDGSPNAITFNNDGTKMYILGSTNDSIYQYTTGSTVATATFDTSTGNYFTHTPSADAEYGFSNAGAVQTFQLEVTGASSGYASVSDWSYDSKSFSTVATSNEANPPKGLAFNNDGTKMFVCSSGSDVVVEYDLSTAYDVSTSVYNSVSFSLSSTATVSQGLEFNDVGTKMYVVGNSTDKIFEYDLSTAFDLSTASYNSVNLSVSSQDTNPFGIKFKPDGTSLYMVGGTNDTVFQYTLTTAFDLSTASYASKSFSVSSQETGPEGIAFNSNGTKMYVTGSTGDDINQYSLSTAFDVSTASFDSLTFSVSAQNNTPRDITFNADGTKIYVVGGAADSVYQYSTSEAITITWDADIEWGGGTAPDSPAAGEKDIYTITTDDGGTTYFGVQSGDAFS
jgi:DNA-binding beta-propeller fold protein YncE